MIKPSDGEKRFASARLRFLKPLLSAYLHRELQYFGPELSELLAQRITEIFEAVCPAPEHVKPGQVVWNALHPETRGDSKGRRFVPVILSLVNEEDTQRLRNGEKYGQVRRDAIVRIFREAHAQGGLLSTRDAGLLFHLSGSRVSAIRQEYEQEHGHTLPHPGVLQDMGSTISHKAVILRKVLLDQKDPADVARETNHSQKAVDNYLSQFHRVETLHKLNDDVAFIHVVTGLSKRLISVYIDLIKEYREPAS